MTDKEELAQTVDTLIPKRLDDVIRQNRELAEFGLSTDDEIHHLKSDIPGSLDKDVKDVIDDWRFVSLRRKPSGPVSVLLLGHSRNEDTPWITSEVLQIDLSHQFVRTKSGSLYSLGAPGKGEPTQGQLIHLCAVLHRWGSGPLLGVPHFFY